MEQATFDDFMKLDIRVGTIVEARPAVVNFPPRQIADFFSQVLVLGTYSQGGVVLITPDKPVENGDRLG